MSWICKSNDNSWNRIEYRLLHNKSWVWGGHYTGSCWFPLMVYWILVCLLTDNTSRSLNPQVLEVHLLQFPLTVLQKVQWYQIRRLLNTTSFEFLTSEPKVINTNAWKWDDSFWKDLCVLELEIVHVEISDFIVHSTHFWVYPGFIHQENLSHSDC